jgi:hypothetical protein
MYTRKFLQQKNSGEIMRRILRLWIFFLTLRRIGSLYLPFGEVIKRESGGNPEQSRCCKFQQNVVSKHSTPLNKTVREGAYQTETSQKTCLAFTGIKLTRNELSTRKSFLLFNFIKT